MSRSPATTIRLSSWGQLMLVLPDHSGAECEILLAEGQEGEILKKLLKTQQRGQEAGDKKLEVGQLAGATWKEMLENEMLASQIQKFPSTARELPKKLETEKSAEELGL